MSIGVSRASFVVCATALLFVSTASGASILTPYNVVVSGNFTANYSDIQGGAEVWGVWNSTDSVGQGIQNGSSSLNEPAEPLSAFPGGVTFVAGGNGGTTNGLGATAATSLNYGEYYVAGTYKTGGGGAGPFLYATCCTAGTEPTNDFSTFETQSSTYASDAQTGATLNVSGTTTTINVTGTGMNVIYVPYADIASGKTVQITNATYSNYLIIDVTGLTAGNTYTLSGNVTIDGFASTNVAADDVLFNFYEQGAFTLNLEGTMIGSVLAPNAAVGDLCGGCTFNGSLVAASYSTTSSVQFHNFNFTSGTPEPAPIACVGLGLIALACVRRRRRRA